ncbi:HAD family hydrolase [Kitasatospora sp. NPDC058243]|uniref:HAD family hydrolase n=1 Tax=Kitasatospora sp. NPDC058243 TaxID=3346397 RepID=UPI0036DF48CE
MRRAALFDVDGVLVDSKAAQLAALAGFATSALGRRINVANLPPWAATAPRAQVLAELGLYGAINEDGWDAATATASLDAVVFPFVRDTLKKLRAEGLATGIVTRRDHRRLGWLLPMDILDLMETAVCYEDATPKPAPDGLHLALHRLGIAPSAAVFVGDTDADIYAARAAGVTSVGAGWGFTEPEALAGFGADLILLDPAELTDVVFALLHAGNPTGTASDLDVRSVTLAGAAGGAAHTGSTRGLRHQ